MLDRYIRIQRESTFKTDPAGASSAPDLLPMASSDLGPPDDQTVQYPGATTRAGLFQTGDIYVPDGNIVLPVDPLEVGHFLQGIFGTRTSTEIGGTGFYDHLFVPTVDPKPSYHIKRGMDHFEYVGQGVMFDQLQFTLNDRFLELTVDAMAGGDTAYPLQSRNETDDITAVNTTDDEVTVSGDVSSNYSSGDTITIRGSTGNDGFYSIDTVTYDSTDDETTIALNETITDSTADGTIRGQSDLSVSNMPSTIFSASDATYNRDSGDISPDVEEFTVTVAQNLDMEGPQPSNQREPGNKGYDRGELDVSLDFTITFNNENELLNFYGGDTQKLSPGEKVEEQTATIDFVETSNEKELSFHLPRMASMSWGAPVNARDRITQEISYDGYTERSSENAMEVTLTNGNDGTKYD